MTTHHTEKTEKKENEKEMEIEKSEEIIMDIVENLMDEVIKRGNKMECTHCGKLYQGVVMLKKHI